MFSPRTSFTMNPWEGQLGFHTKQGMIQRSPFLGQDLRCWRTDNEGAVCSNLMYYSPNCPTTPPITESEILPTPPEAPGAS